MKVAAQKPENISSGNSPFFRANGTTGFFSFPEKSELEKPENTFETGAVSILISDVNQPTHPVQPFFPGPVPIPYPNFLKNEKPLAETKPQGIINVGITAIKEQKENNNQVPAELQPENELDNRNETEEETNVKPDLSPTKNNDEQNSVNSVENRGQVQPEASNTKAVNSTSEEPQAEVEDGNAEPETETSNLKNSFPEQETTEGKDLNKNKLNITEEEGDPANQIQANSTKSDESVSPEDEQEAQNQGEETNPESEVNAEPKYDNKLNQENNNLQESTPETKEGLENNPGNGEARANEYSADSKTETSSIDIQPNKNKNQGLNDSFLRILMAPDSELKHHGVTQSLLIQASRSQSIQEIKATGNSHRKSVYQHFSAVQSHLISFFENNILTIKTIYLSQKAFVTDLATTAISNVTGLVLNAISRGEQMGALYSGIIQGMISRASITVMNKVFGVVNKIQGFVASLPIPNIPGIDRIREMVQNLTANITGILINALGVALGIIQNVFTIGLSLLTAILNVLRTKIIGVLSRVISVVLNAMRKIQRVLALIYRRVTRMLRRVLHGRILPLVFRLRRRVLQFIRRLELSSLLQINLNADNSLERIASIVESDDGEGTKEPDENNQKTKRQNIIVINLIGARSLLTNMAIVRFFKLKALRLISLFVTAIQDAKSFIISRILPLISRAISTILSKVFSVIRKIGELVKRVAKLLRLIVLKIISKFSNLFSRIASMLRNPMQRIFNVVKTTFTRIRNAISRLISRFLPH